MRARVLQLLRVRTSSGLGHVRIPLGWTPADETGDAPQGELRLPLASFMATMLGHSLARRAVVSALISMTERPGIE